MRYWKKNRILILEIAIVALFILLVALQGSKLFTLDEMDFPTVAKATSQTLRPVWYKGEVTSHQSGLFHPPLYIYSLAGFIRVFGFSEMSVRMFGMICALVTSLLLINILKLFNFRNRWGEVLLLGLFLLNPYTLACATVPDIDTTIMPITMLLFIYASLRFYWKRDVGSRYSKYSVWILGLLFTLNLWTKLTTPLMLPFFLFALLLLCGKPLLSSIITTLKVTLLGSVAFLVTYFVYTKAVELPMSYTFSFLIQSFTKGTAGNQTLVQKILSNGSDIKTQIYWLTVPLTFTYVVSLISLCLRKKFNEQTKIILLLSLFGTIIFVFYQCLIAPFGGFFKYQFPIFGLMILTIVFYFQTKLYKVKLNVYMAFAALALSFLFSTKYIRDTVFLNHTAFKGFIYLVIAVIVVYLLLNYKKTIKLAQLSFVYFLLVVIGYQLGISRVQAISTYPTKYLYGQQGMSEAISYLKLNTKPNEVIWSMKDIGFYVNDRYYENYPFFFDKKLDPTLVNMLKTGKIRYYVATTGIGEDRIDYYKDIANILNENATEVASFGNFVIYRSNNASPN